MLFLTHLLLFTFLLLTVVCERMEPPGSVAADVALTGVAVDCTTLACTGSPRRTVDVATEAGC